jgi:DNA-binding IclR family transcriptional regulator
MRCACMVAKATSRSARWCWKAGSRRPLGVGAGGLAILSAIEEEERAVIIERVSPSLQAFGKLTAQTLVAARPRASESGVAVTQTR